MSSSDHLPKQPTGHQPDKPDVADKVRIVKKIPPLEPLDQEKRYGKMHHAHVSVFTGLFAWALRQDRFGKKADRKVKLHSRSFGPDGLQAPTYKAKNKATFSNYFSLGTQQDLKPMETENQPHIHRNRLVFLAVLIGLAAYTLVWISR